MMSKLPYQSTVSEVVGTPVGAADGAVGDDVGWGMGDTDGADVTGAVVGRGVVGTADGAAVGAVVQPAQVNAHVTLAISGTWSLLLGSQCPRS